MNSSQSFKSDQKVSKSISSRDHRTIAHELDLYLLNEKAGQGLPLLLPN